MDLNQEHLMVLVDGFDFEKPLFNIDCTQPNEDGVYFTTLLLHKKVDPANQFFDLDLNDKFDDISTEILSSTELLDFPSLNNGITHVACQSEDADDEYLDTMYEKMCREQKWFSKSFFPSRRGRKRKSSTDNREETNSNNFSCRKYRHKKTDEKRSALIKRLRTLIKAEKIELEKILDEQIVKKSLKDFLNFKI